MHRSGRSNLKSQYVFMGTNMDIATKWLRKIYKTIYLLILFKSNFFIFFIFNFWLLKPSETLTKSLTTDKFRHTKTFIYVWEIIKQITFYLWVLVISTNVHKLWDPTNLPIMYGLRDQEKVVYLRSCFPKVILFTW